MKSRNEFTPWVWPLVAAAAAAAMGNRGPTLKEPVSRMNLYPAPASVGPTLTQQQHLRLADIVNKLKLN